MRVPNLFSKTTNSHPEKNRAPVSSSLFPRPNHAVVSVEISPDLRGRICYQGTYWFGCALNDVYIAEGTIVEVIERRGNTWLVKPVTDEAFQPEAYQATDYN